MGDTPASPASAAEADDGDSSGQRGFLGRILNALSGGDAPVSAASVSEATGSEAPVPTAAGIGKLKRMRVEDVAIPKVEIAAVPVTISMDDLVQTFRESGFSRLPVYKGTLDSPMGIIHLKDLALQHGFGENKARFSLRRMLRPLLYVPPSMPAAVLLQKMQNERVHMALVIDEYGGVDGLVTIEDLLEEVVGEIEDEHDTEDTSLWVLEKPGQYLVQSRAPLEDFEAEIGVKLTTDDEHEEVDTLGGFVFMLTGRVPARGEVIPHESGVEFEIVDADPRRVKRIRVRLPQGKV